MIITWKVKEKYEDYCEKGKLISLLWNKTLWSFSKAVISEWCLSDFKAGDIHHCFYTNFGNSPKPFCWIFPMSSGWSETWILLYYILNKVINLTDLHGMITGQKEPSLAAERWGEQLQGKKIKVICGKESNKVMLSAMSKLTISIV